MKRVASIEVLHKEQAMQSWTMPDKIECFFPSVAPGVGYGAFQEQTECCC